MEWRRPDNYYLVSDQGYQISASRCGGWKFTAWGPELDYWSDYIKWVRGNGTVPPKGVEVRVTYQIGQALPTKRVSLGTYDDIDLAKRCCEDHLRKKLDGINSAA